MKTHMLVFALGLMYLHSQAATGKPSKEKDKTNSGTHKTCLELSGTAELDGKRINQFTVKLYMGDVVVKTSPASKKDRIKFMLEENREYTLCFSRPGCIDRLIRIDTHLPAGVEASPPFEFDFEMEMLADSGTGSQDTDFPAGLIVYDPSTQKFERSRKYTSGLKKVIKAQTVAASR